MENSLSFLQTIIYAISSSLFYPVIILLVILTGWIIIFSGGIFAQWVKRKILKKNIDILQYLEEIQKKKILPDVLKTFLPKRVLVYSEKLTCLCKNKDHFFHEKVESLIQEKELKLAKEVNQARLLTRIGPGLGLMGTLIPMGTGLASLSQGDMTQMTSNLIIAFTTTVVGLALGLLAYVFSIIINHWMQEDIRNIELITEAMTKGE
jgi:biopolymer transport protein ExbB/TolQ